MIFRRSPEGVPPNVLVIRIQPDEGIALTVGTPCEFKVGDTVGMVHGDGSLDPKYTGTVKRVHLKGPPDGGYYDCHYVVRRPDASSFSASEVTSRRPSRDRRPV